MLSRFFIQRPKFALVISIILTLAGAISLAILPVAEYPKISPPSVSVTAFYTGASAEVVEQAIADPIETSVNGVEDMIYMSSKSANDGSYNLNVTFDVGTDADMAQVNVQNRVAQIESKLPQEVRMVGVTRLWVLSHSWVTHFMSAVPAAAHSACHFFSHGCGGKLVRIILMRMAPMKMVTAAPLTRSGLGGNESS